MKFLILKINICWCQSKQFTFPYSTPVKNLERIIRYWLVFNTFYELEIFFFCPEIHLISFTFTNRSSLFYRIFSQIVKAYCMIKYGWQLWLHCFQISRLIGLTICLSLLDHLILPFDNIRRTDFIHLLFFEIWNQLLLKNDILCTPRVKLQLRL